MLAGCPEQDRDVVLYFAEWGAGMPLEPERGNP
jgi:hypothetical protein